MFIFDPNLNTSVEHAQGLNTMRLSPSLRKKVVEALNASANALLQQDLRVKTKAGIVRISLDPSVAISVMAYTREMYMDRVKEKLSGGCREHFKAVFAKRELALRKKRKEKIPKGLEQQKWVDHWQREAETLLEEQLPEFLLHDVKFSKAGREKAAMQALDSFMEDSFSTRASAALSFVKKDYGLPRTLCSVEDTDAEGFKKLALGIINKTFQGGGSTDAT